MNDQTIQHIQIPVSQEKWLQLNGKFPLTPEEWDTMIKILETMKPALVGGMGELNLMENKAVGD